MSTAERPSPRIDLAHEPDYRLGDLEIHPSVCAVAYGDRREVLQPRIMQVLTALAHADGEVVSHDDLIDSCWEGRIVGADAVQRCLGRLRKLAQASDGFTLETVPRVGYRLIARPASCVAATTPPLSRSMTIRWLAPALAAGATALIVALLVAARPTRAPEWRVESSRMVVAAPVIQRYPALSRNGGLLAYSAGATIKSRQIFVLNLAGGDPVRLTFDSFDDISPDWSHQGDRLLFIASRAGEPCRIMALVMPGGAPRELGRCQVDERTRAIWAPDDQAVFLLDRPSPALPERVMRLDLRSGQRVSVSRPPPDSLGDEEPSLSPDGRRLAFLRHPNHSLEQVIVHDLSSGAEHSVTERFAVELAAVAWAEDSQSLFVAMDKDGDAALWAYPVNGGQRDRLTTSPTAFGRMTTAPGGLLAVEVNAVHTDLAEPPLRPGEPPRLIQAVKAQTWDAAIAADGTVAMGSDRWGAYGLWTMSPGQAPHLLRAFKSEIFSPAWSPDGSRLALNTSESSAPGILILDRSGRTLESIPMATPAIGHLVWSADGGSVLFSAKDRRGWRIWRASLSAPQRPVAVTPYGWLSVRVRGDELYGVRDGWPGVWRISSEPKRVSSMPASDADAPWAIFDDAIIYPVSTGSGWRLLAQPIAGGPPRPYADTPDLEPRDGFALDPRSGKVIYPARTGVTADIQLFRLSRR